MALLSEDEKRALRQKQKLLYSSGQFPLAGNQRRRAKKPVSPVKLLIATVVVVALALVGLVAILTSAG